METKNWYRQIGSIAMKVASGSSTVQRTCMLEGKSEFQYMCEPLPPVFFGSTGLLPLQVIGQLDQGPQAAVHGLLSYVTHNGGQSWDTNWKIDPDTLTTFQPILPGLSIVDPQHAWATNPNDGSVSGSRHEGSCLYGPLLATGQRVSPSGRSTSLIHMASQASACTCPSSAKYPIECSL